jgi:ribonuclease P protein component
MLPRQYRLPANIRLSNPITYSSPSFHIKFSPNNLDCSRFGFIIGKVVSKKAVERNRARRLVRSCIEERLQKITSGHDMLFLFKKGIIDKDREALTSEIEKFLTQKKLLKDLPTQ